MKSYLVSQVEVIDQEAWEHYRELAAPAIAKYGGTYLVRGARPEVIEGDDWAPPNADGQQIIIAEFPSDLAIHAWYDSPEYAQAFAYRQQAVHRRLLFVDGIDEQSLDRRRLFLASDPGMRGDVVRRPDARARADGDAGHATRAA